MRQFFGVMCVFGMGCGGGALPLGPEAPPCPNPQVRVASIDFTQSLFSVVQSQEVVIANECTGEQDTALMLSVPDDLGLSVRPQTVTLPANEAIAITVEYQANGYTPVDSFLTVQWSDEASVSIPVHTEPARDQDRDGYDAAEVGGEDCDDQNPTVYPAASEASNLLDDDCDGWVDEDFVAQGDVYVSELMILPKAVAMETGQWFELTSVANTVLNLRNWEVRSGTGEQLILPELILSPGQRVILAVDDDPVNNGGLSPDVTYSYAAFPLKSNFGSLELWLDTRAIGYLEYDVSWPIGVGASIAADPVLVTDALTATRGTWWCISTSAMTGGDRGTPGLPNDFCSGLDHDGDGYSEQDGDCDDANPAISPVAEEVWDDVDNDCDGETDRMVVQERRIGLVSGERNSRLGEYGFMGVGDIDADSIDEVVITSRYGVSGSVGTAYVLRAEEYDAWRTTAARHADIRYDDDSGITHNIVSPRFGDNDGDGAADLVLMGTGYAYTAEEQPGVAVFTSLTPGTDIDVSDADLYFYSEVYSYNTGMIVSDLDMTGDGVAELVFGRQQYAYGVIGALSIIDASGMTAGRYEITESQLSEYTPNASNAVVGVGLAGGDWNEDGYDDIVVRQALIAMGYSGGGDDVLYGVTGEADPLGYADIDDVASFEIQNLSRSQHLRDQAHSQLVDVDGSGSLDLVVPNSDDAEILVFFDVQDLDGRYSASDADVVLAGDHDVLGSQLASGDVNGDGRADVIVSGFDRSGGYYGLPTHGTVSVYNGGDWMSAPPTEPSAVFSTLAPNDLLGSGLLVFDFNGDGFDDVMIGASSADSYAGEASVLLRGAP